MKKKLLFFIFACFSLNLQALPTKHITISEVEVRIPKKLQQKNPFPQAVDQGKKEAFNRMLLGFSRELINKKITDEEIGDLISKVQVIKEIRTKTVYRAKLVYYFNRAKVEEFIQAKTKHLDVPHILPKTNLLIPVLTEGEGTPKIWGEDNQWRKLWMKQAETLPLMVPMGDLEDINLLKATTAENTNPEKLAKILKKYHCTKCVFVSAKLGKATESEITGDFQAKALPLESEGDKAFIQVNLTAPSEEEVMTQAVENLVPEVKKVIGVKEPLKVAQDHMTAIRVHVPFSNPGEYYKVEDCLKKIGLVHHVETESISLDEARLNLLCFGDKEALEKALDEQGLLLQAMQNRLNIINKPVPEIIESLEGEGVAVTHD